MRAHAPDLLAVPPEHPHPTRLSVSHSSPQYHHVKQHSRGAPDGDGERGEDRVPLAVPEGGEHRGREEREAEAREGPEERDRGESCGWRRRGE